MPTISPEQPEQRFKTIWSSKFGNWQNSNDRLKIGRANTLGWGGRCDASKRKNDRLPPLAHTKHFTLLAAQARTLLSSLAGWRLSGRFWRSLS